MMVFNLFVWPYIHLYIDARYSRGERSVEPFAWRVEVADFWRRFMLTWCDRELGGGGVFGDDRGGCSHAKRAFRGGVGGTSVLADPRGSSAVVTSCRVPTHI